MGHLSATNVGQMGQLVGVVEKKSGTPGYVRFELNRTLTGMGHEHFAQKADAVGTRPSAELARRLFSTGQVAGVHLFANIVTVDLAKGQTSEGLAEIVRDLYQYWKPGMTPPAFEDLVPAEEPQAAPAAGASEGGDAPLSAAASRVPAHLLERSRAALAKWKATHGG
jgi:hypothetical protein